MNLMMARQRIGSPSRHSAHENGGLGRSAVFLNLGMPYHDLGPVLNRERGVAFQIDLRICAAHGARKRAEDLGLRE